MVTLKLLYVLFVQPRKEESLSVVAGCVIPINKFTCSSMVVTVKLPCSSCRDIPAVSKRSTVSVLGTHRPALQTTPHLGRKKDLFTNRLCKSQQVMPVARQTTASLRHQSYPRTTATHTRASETQPQVQGEFSMHDHVNVHPRDVDLHT